MSFLILPHLEFFFLLKINILQIQLTLIFFCLLSSLTVCMAAVLNLTFYEEKNVILQELRMKMNSLQCLQQLQLIWEVPADMQ